MGPVRAAVAIGLVALATVAGAWSMGTLVEPGSWLGPGLVVLLPTMAVVLALRIWSGSQWLPTVVAAVFGGYLIAWTFAPGTGLPGLSSGAELLELARQGVQDTATRPPVIGSSGLALWIVAALLVVFLSAELITVGLQAPAWAGLVLLAPWIPAVALEQQVPAAVFAVAAGAYLGVVVLGALGPAAGRRRRAARRSAVAVAAAAVAVALVAAPAVVSLPAPSWVTGGGGGGGGATRLDLGLDVSEHLVRGSDEVLYTYQASHPGQVGPLHAYTLTGFTGSRWVRDQEPGGETVPVRAGEVLWPAPVQAGAAEQWLEVQIGELAQDRLLLPDRPRSLTIAGDWVYHGPADEVIGSGPTPLEYRVELVERDLDPLRLHAARVGDGDGLDPAALEVPDTGHQEQIEAVARRVVQAAGAESPYAQAVALQDFLRLDSQFTYDVQVDPARTSDAVWDFLGSGRGYCVQFATAMIIMARTLDIPARMAVGFLPGEENDDGGVVVSGHRAHTWPQLYFEDVGWVRFEPTPPERTGAPPPWAVGLPEDVEVPQTQDVPDVTADADALQPDTATDTPVPAGAADGEGPGAGVPAWAWGALGVIVAGAALLVWRRRRLQIEVERSWGQVQQAAAGVRPDLAHPGETPRGLVTRVQLAEPAGGALVRLARAVEHYRYDRPGREEPSGSDLRRWRDEALRALRDRART